MSDAPIGEPFNDNDDQRIIQRHVNKEAFGDDFFGKLIRDVDQTVKKIDFAKLGDGIKLASTVGGAALNNFLPGAGSIVSTVGNVAGGIIKEGDILKQLPPIDGTFQLPQQTAVKVAPQCPPCNFASVVSSLQLE
jgi:hypothetical protein